MFSVVIPTYNRLPNLRLTLAALDNQINPPPFEVIVSDDGSRDDTRLWIKDNINSFPRFDLRYQWCGPNLGFRSHRTRNLGVAQAKYHWIVLLDSDVLLNPNAMIRHQDLRNKFPDVVVVGLYHWSENKPLSVDDVNENFDNVMALVPDSLSIGAPHPGLDMRTEGYTDELDESEIITEYDGLGFFGGNQSWPTKLWWNLGGQDELMPSGQGEDAEMGQKLRLAEIPVLQYKPVWGVHVHHHRDQAMAQRMVNESIAYIDRKHGIGTYAELTDAATDPREKNLSIWYTREQDAMMVKKVGDLTVYAVTGDGKGYVGIPNQDWLNLLGFNIRTDVQIVEDDFFDDKKFHGLIIK